MNFEVEEITLKLTETSIKFGWVGSSWVRRTVPPLTIWNYELELQLGIDNELFGHRNKHSWKQHQIRFMSDQTGLAETVFIMWLFYSVHSTNITTGVLTST
jgi:hypothetical protein